ncbi:unnamed protein product [Protopolystoma xenopodis]|uniref:Uncharacterized protein n=1 Tax=Protopolystoma xenopodis TaxID=117903 RepID=A0A3S5B6G5_9PLAT|nr:unnamed protein product [Protopolystoma xenopodis]
MPSCVSRRPVNRLHLFSASYACLPLSSVQPDPALLAAVPSAEQQLSRHLIRAHATRPSPVRMRGIGIGQAGTAVGPVPPVLCRAVAEASVPRPNKGCVCQTASSSSPIHLQAPDCLQSVPQLVCLPLHFSFFLSHSLSLSLSLTHSFSLFPSLMTTPNRPQLSSFQSFHQLSRLVASCW